VPNKNPQFARHFESATKALLAGMDRPQASHFIDAQYATRQAANAAQTGPEQEAAKSLADLVAHVASIYGLSIR
jgi:hypothetical protein